MAVGIEKLGVYPCSLVLDMETLCQARGKDAREVREVMLIDQRSVNPAYEDPVTMAVNAAKDVLTEEDRQSIELLVVASESGLDFEKPLSSWVHRYLGLNNHCRNFELKHACYAGTAGLQMAANWLAAQSASKAKALVIATDQSRAHFGKDYEVVTGAGAAAVLLSHEPRVLELELDRCGYYASEVHDLIRPTASTEVGHAETSLMAYLDGLEGAYAHYVECVGEVNFERDFARAIYHVPFGGITFLAHKTLLREEREVSKSEAWQDFARRSLPALRYNRRMGGTYAASTFIALAGLMDGEDRPSSGDRLSVFAFGSGSCAEFYSGIVGPSPREAVAEAGIESLLNRRRPLTVPEYEQAEMERESYLECPDFEPRWDSLDGWYARHYEGNGLLVLRGAQGYRREYAWS